MFLSEERFAQVTQAAEHNIRTALDLISIHSERPVRGQQPRASLNPFTVLAAVGSWERFIADLTSAASKSAWRGPGGHQASGGDRPSCIDDRMSKLVRGNVTALWEVRFPAGGWRGSQPRGWKTVRRSSGAADREELLGYLAHTYQARHAAAHYALAQNARQAAEQAGFEDGWYPWQSDAKDPSLQSGYARGVTAVYLQLIDSTNVAVAQAQGWTPGRYRLPADWFQAEAATPRFAGVQLWRGASLHRMTG